MDIVSAIHRHNVAPDAQTQPYADAFFFAALDEQTNAESRKGVQSSRHAGAHDGGYV